MAAQELIHTSLRNDPNLKAYYRMESGALTTDSSGNNETLTNNNTVGEGVGKFGGAADFGAANTNKSLSRAGTIGGITNGNITILGWVKLNAEIAANEWEIFQHQNATNFVEYYVRYQYNAGTRRLVFARNRANVANDNFSYNVTLGTSVYVLIAITYDGTTIRGYVNDTEVGTVASSGDGTSALTNYFAIGGNAEISLWSSALFDDVAVLNRQLSGVEISNLYNGLLGSSSVSSSPSVSISLSASVSVSLSPSRSPSISISLSPSISLSTSVSSSISPSSSISASLSPSPSVGYSVFTRGNESSLPSSISDLETTYSEDEEEQIATRDDIKIGQTGMLEYMLHQFKSFVGSQTYGTIEVELQSTLDPKYSTVYLQIFNNNTGGWETIASNSESDSDVDFELSATVADLTNYKSESSVVVCRVYQLAI